MRLTQKKEKKEAGSHAPFGLCVCVVWPCHLSRVDTIVCVFCVCVCVAAMLGIIHQLMGFSGAHAISSMQSVIILASLEYSTTRSEHNGRNSIGGVGVQVNNMGKKRECTTMLGLCNTTD